MNLLSDIDFSKLEVKTLFVQIGVEIMLQHVNFGVLETPDLLQTKILSSVAAILFGGGIFNDYGS